MAVWDWVTTAADNDDADSAINWAEGQAPSTVNDSARSMMARISHWLNTLSGNVTMGGASNAYTLTTGESLSAYPSNFRVLWQPNADSTGAVTLNVDGLGAKKVYMPDGTQAGSGDLDADSMYDVAYDSALDSASGGFKIIGFPDTTLTAADYLTAANNLSDLASASTARSNLGLGTMAVETASNYLTTATAASTYAALSGAAFTGSVTMAADFNVDSGTLFVDISTDRVGVGETSPDYPLHVTSTGNIQFKLENSSTGNARMLFTGSTNEWNVGLVESTDIFSFYDGVSNVVQFVGGAPANSLYINASGNVGIGTASPLYELDVNGEILARVAVGGTTTGTITSAWLNRSIFATGTITLAASIATTGDMIGPILGNGGARTISRGTMTNMFVNGTNVSSCTLTARGAATVIFSSATTCYVVGDVS